MRQIAHSWYDTLMGHDDGSLNRDGPAHGQSTSLTYEMLAGSPGSTLRRDSGTGKDLGGVDVDPELEGQVCGPEEPPPHETLRTVGAIVKAFIGSGILFLPSAFQQGGYAFSVVLMFMMAFLNGFGMMRLLQCREKVVGSFGFVGYRALGRVGQVAVDVSLVLSQAGFCCVYVSFIAQNGLQLLNAGKCWLTAEWLWVLILVQFFIFVPLTWVRRIASFGPAVLVADALILLGLVGIIAYSIHGLADYASAGSGRPLTLEAFNQKDFALFLGTAIYAFEGIGMTTPLYNSLSPRGQARFPWTLACTLGGVSVAYVVFGLVPYLYFAGVSGITMTSAVTLDLPRVWWAYLIKAGYCIALAVSYPFMFAPAIAICEKPLVPSRLAPVVNETHGVWRRNAFRAALVVCTLVVSLAGARQLNNFVSLIGAFCCAPLAFVYPCAFHLVLMPEKGRLSKAADVAMVIFGVGVFAFSSWQAIAGWAVSVAEPCV